MQCQKRNTAQPDTILFPPGLIATVKAVNKLKPWQTNKAVKPDKGYWDSLIKNQDLNAELRKLGLKKKDLKLSGDAPLLLDTENSAVDRVGLASCPARLF